MIEPPINYLKFRRYILKQLLATTGIVSNTLDAEIHLRMYLYCFHNTDEDRQWMYAECNTLNATLRSFVLNDIESNLVIELLELTEKLIEERETENGK